MVFSLFFLGIAQAAEPTEYWSPSLSELGAEALIAGEFDGVAGLDLIASYREGDAFGLAVFLSGVGETWTLTPEVPISALQLRTAQWDEDSEEEVLLGMPEYSSAGHAVGAVWVLDFSELEVQPATLESVLTFSVLGDEQDGAFGTDVQLADCHSNTGPELIVSAPTARNGGKVVAIASSGDSVALGQWSRTGGAGLFGVALGLVTTASGQQLSVASCATTSGNCAGDGELFLIPMSSCDSTQFVDEDDASFSALSARPMKLVELLEGSASEDSALLWSAEGSKAVLALESGSQLTSVSTQNDRGDFVQTENPSVQSWMSSGGSVWQLPGELGPAIGTEKDQVEHALDGVDLGLRLASVGDLDSDGCGDVLASSGAGEHVYLLSGCSSEKPDTGDTGKPDTGDTGDTSQQDTGETGDTGRTDTGETANPDTGDGPCQERFGWACTTASSPLGLHGMILLSIVFFWTSRRRQTE